jgi:hypothetical protein
LIAEALSADERRKLIADLDPNRYGENGPAIRALRDACEKMKPKGWFRW